MYNTLCICNTLCVYIYYSYIQDILLVALSVFVFGSPVTLLQYIGYGVALFGLNLHKEYKKSPDKIAALLTYMATCGTSASNNNSINNV